MWFVPLLAALSSQSPHSPTYPQLLSTRYSLTQGLPAGSSRFVRDSVVPTVELGTQQYILTADGKWVHTDYAHVERMPPGITVDVAPPGERVTSWVTTRAGDVLVVTEHRALRRHAGRWAPLDLPRSYKAGQPTPHIDSVIRHVYADSAGTVWISTDHGLYATDGGDWWHPLNRDDGMPYEDMLCCAVAPNGDLWGGTTQGAWRLRAGNWAYFWGPRWLPGNRVNSITFDAGGAMLLATDKGVARIEERFLTLEQKAAHYEEILIARHNRRGYVTHSALKKPGDPAGGFIHEASDNDGLWTAIYVGAESFRYAATKSPEARTLAKKSLEALLDLTRLSGVPGFPARALIRKGEEVTGYDPDETVRIDGEPEKIWYQSKVDPNILCKGDTSSDELDGHFFAYQVYYDLVADEAEKAAMRPVVRAIMTNILDHQYTLVGHTGRKTRWGVFGPQYLNEDPRWFDERGLNSAELLCYLKVAHHVCGDKRFADAYDELIQKHHYLLNMLNYRRQAPWWAVNHSDDELAFLVYYPLLILEKEPARRAVLVQAVSSAWKGLADTRASLYDYIFGAGTGGPCREDEARLTLREWPWELIDWPVRNSQRHDVTLRQAQGGRNRTEIDRVLPMSERTIWRWNGDPYEPDGGNAATESDGAAFLLPYWMGRYHRLVE